MTTKSLMEIAVRQRQIGRCPLAMKTWCILTMRYVLEMSFQNSKMD